MNKFVQAWVSNTPPETLEQLATDKDPYVRWGVAYNPNTPTKTLEQLATDKYFDVRCGVAYNPNTPQYIKRFLKIQEQLKSLLAN